MTSFKVERNITDAKDNFTIGIDQDQNDDDDDDANSSGTKRQRIGELLKGNEILEVGLFPISKGNILDLMIPGHLPPEFTFNSNSYFYKVIHQFHSIFIVRLFV